MTAANGVGPTAAESAATKIVQPLVIKAVLHDNPSVYFCTGIPITFDGSASKTPNPPIVNYKLSYVEFPVQAGLLILGGPGALEEFLASLPVHQLDSQSHPIMDETFTWSKIATEKDTDPPYVGQPWREPIQVTLTVTDLAGATASASVTLLPAQTSALESRSKCPKSTFIRLLPSIIGSHVSAVLAGGAVSAKMSCTSTVPCAGSIQVISAVGRLTARAAKSKPVVLARSKFFTIPRHRSATIRAPLTKKGHALLKPGRSVPVLIKLTSVMPSGKKSARTIRVTLKHR